MLGFFFWRRSGGSTDSTYYDTVLDFSCSSVADLDAGSLSYNFTQSA